MLNRSRPLFHPSRAICRKSRESKKREQLVWISWFASGLSLRTRSRITALGSNRPIELTRLYLSSKSTRAKLNHIRHFWSPDRAEFYDEKDNYRKLWSCRRNGVKVNSLTKICFWPKYASDSCGSVCNVMVLAQWTWFADATKTLRQALAWTICFKSGRLMLNQAGEFDKRLRETTVFPCIQGRRLLARQNGVSC